MSALERPVGEVESRAGVLPAPKRVIEVAHFWQVIVTVLAAAVLIGAGRLFPWLLMPLGVVAMLGWHTPTARMTSRRGSRRWWVRA